LASSSQAATIDVGPNGTNVSRLGVSAQLVAGNNRFTALRSFDAYTCRAGKVAEPDL
jgi:hypothetical protein